MKNVNKIIQLTFGLAMLLFLAACENALEEEVFVDIASNNFFQNIQILKLNLNINFLKKEITSLLHY